MHIIPVSTTLLKAGDDLAFALSAAVNLKNGDILVVSSKAVAVTEGGTVALEKMPVGKRAAELAAICGQDALFTQFVLQETERLGGQVTGTCPTVLMTTLKPAGMKKGCIVCPNAGADLSNTAAGTAIGWPNDAATSVRMLRDALEKIAGVRIGLLLSDSCCRPSRQGVTAFALTVCGFDPVRSDIGKKDLHGNALRITQEAVADQLATAANMVMGNAAQCIPAAVIRDHDIPLSDFCGWVDGIEPEDDLFRDMLGWKEGA